MVAALLSSIFLLLSIKISAQSVCQNLDPSPALAQFVDPLPFPSIIDLRKGTKKTPLVLGAYKIKQKLHRELPETTVYGYGTGPTTATYPGPTILAMRKVPITVKWENHITDSSHILLVDSTLNLANPSDGVPIVTHLHGGEVAPFSDGNPYAWFTATGQTGSAYTTNTYVYPNAQFPTLLWYHDHAMGRTRLNVYAGLAGLYVLTSKEEQKSNLPDVFSPFHIPLVIQDKQFFADGSLNFPTVGLSPLQHPSWCPENFGDTLLVNGKVWPYLDVQPVRYRFRILNGANARFFTLSFSNSALIFTKIATDGGFLSQPLTLSTITLAPGERADVVVDFSTLAVGTEIVLINSAKAPFPVGDNPAGGTAAVMKFRVIAANSKAASFKAPLIPKQFGPDSYAARPCIKVRRHILQEIYDDADEVTTIRINNLTFMDPATEKPKLGTTEIWEIINLTPDAHPIHVHLVRFRMLSQQEFDKARFEKKTCNLTIQFPDPSSCYSKAAVLPDNDQKGWKDTVVVWPGFVTRLLITFSGQGYSSFPFDPTQAPGYVWHCHIVDHEDNDMMRPLVLVP